MICLNLLPDEAKPAPSFVYVIHGPTGLYVGKTYKSAKTRLRQHFSTARSNSPTLLHKAIRKYGEESFSIEIVASATSDADALECERQVIAQERANGQRLYNLTDGGDGPKGYKPDPVVVERIAAQLRGRPLSLEHRQKVSASLMGRQVSEETRQRISEINKGKKFSLEHCLKLSISHLGNKQSEESKAKISATMKGVPKSPETKRRMSEAQKRKAAERRAAS